MHVFPVDVNHSERKGTPDYGVHERKIEVDVTVEEESYSKDGQKHVKRCLPGEVRLPFVLWVPPVLP